MVVHSFPSGKRYCTVHRSNACDCVNKVYSEGDNPPYLISDGTHKSNGGDVVPQCPPLTERQLRALDLYNANNSISFIAKSLGISKGSAYDLVKRAVRSAQQKGLTPKRLPLTIAQPTPLTIRLHDDEFKFLVRANYGEVLGIVKCAGRNLEYKMLSYDSGIHMKLHRNGSLTVRFKDAILSDSEDKAYVLADERLMSFIRLFNFEGISIVSDKKLISRHYGLVGSSMARKIIDERKLIIVRDPDGRVRLRIDGSPVTGFAKGEVDAEHTEKGRSDISQTREYFSSIINKPHYTPDEVKGRIDSSDERLGRVVDVLDGFATEFKVHSVVQHKQESNMDKMSVMLDRLGDKISNSNVLSANSVEMLQDSDLNCRNSCFYPRTISKYDVERRDRILGFKKDFGW